DINQCSDLRPTGPRWSLRAFDPALAGGRLERIVSARLLAELKRALGYPKLRAASLRRHRTSSLVWFMRPGPPNPPTRSGGPLPFAFARAGRSPKVLRMYSHFV